MPRGDCGPTCGPTCGWEIRKVFMFILAGHFMGKFTFLLYSLQVFYSKMHSYLLSLIGTQGDVQGNDFYVHFVTEEVECSSLYIQLFKGH